VLGSRYRQGNGLGQCCIPSVMVEVGYAGGDRAVGYWGETGTGSCWTLKNRYSRLQPQFL